MQHYKNKPENFPLFRKQVLSRSIPLTVAAVLMGMAISYYNQGDAGEGYQAILIYMGLIAVVLAYSILMGMKRQKAVFESYELIIAPDYFLRKQTGLTDKKILFEEVESISQAGKGFLGIKGREKNDIISVPPYLENYGEVKSFLEAMKPIATKEYKSLLVRYAWIPMLLVIALMCAVYISENAIIVGLSGMLLIALLLWSLYITQTSTLIDKQVKRKSWWILVLLVSVALAVYYKVFVGVA